MDFGKSLDRLYYVSQSSFSEFVLRMYKHKLTKNTNNESEVLNLIDPYDMTYLDEKWEKFSKSIMAYWISLDDDNRKKFMSWITQK